MRGCGTQFNDEPGQLSDLDIEVLRQIEILAAKHEAIARQLKLVVQKCNTAQTIQGIDEMVAFSFNAQAHQPNYGGGGGGLPVGKYKGVIANSELVTTKDNVTQAVKGGYMALTLTPIEGPLVGQSHVDRLNLHHTNPKVVEIANEQLSAYCHVTGRFVFNDTAELHNIPFCFEIGYQRGQEPTAEKPNGGYTEVKAIFDVNGNPPGKAGSGPAPAAQQPPAQQPPAQQPPAQQPPAGVTAQGQQPWGGAPAQQPPAGQQPPAQQPGATAWGQQPPAGGAPAGGAPWGAPAA